MDEGMNPFIKDFPSSAWKPNILFFLSYNLINTCLNIICLNLFFLKSLSVLCKKCLLKTKQ